MRRVLICTGVLGGGTALVFALAALTATLFPHGTAISTGGGWSQWEEFARPMPEMDGPALFVMDDEGKP